MNRRRLLIGSVSTVGLVGVAALTGCRSEQAAEPRPLTTAEAERLAVIRFNSFNEGTRKVDAHVVGTPSPLRLSGWVDFRTHNGYAQVVTAGSPPEELGLVRWTFTIKSSRPAPLPASPLPPPPDGWDVQPLVPNQAVFDTALSLLLQAGADRPENPLLLAQSDARWLRADQVRDTPVDVMTGPSSNGAPGDRLRYWVTADGHLLRMEVMLGQTSSWSTFDFSEANGTTIPELKR